MPACPTCSTTLIPATITPTITVLNHYLRRHLNLLFGPCNSNATICKAPENRNTDQKGQRLPYLFCGPHGPFLQLPRIITFFRHCHDDQERLTSYPPCPHESTDAQRHRSEWPKTNMQATVPTQNTYAGTWQHAKQICKHTVARKTNIPLPGGTQNKYGSTWRNTKQICRLPAAQKNKYAGNQQHAKRNMQARWHAEQICHELRARKTNMPSPASMRNKYESTRRYTNQICRHPSARKTKMLAHVGTQNEYAITWWNAKHICHHLVECKTNMPKVMAYLFCEPTCASIFVLRADGCLHICFV